MCLGVRLEAVWIDLERATDQPKREPERGYFRRAVSSHKKKGKKAVFASYFHL